mgnify:CR=1 FL=1
MDLTILGCQMSKYMIQAIHEKNLLSKKKLTCIYG